MYCRYQNQCCEFCLLNNNSKIKRQSFFSLENLGRKRNNDPNTVENLLYDIHSGEFNENIITEITVFFRFLVNDKLNKKCLSDLISDSKKLKTELLSYARQIVIGMVSDHNFN